MKRTSFSLTALALVLTACSDPTEPREQTPDAFSISSFVVGFTTATPPIGKIDIPCPAGGKRVIDGTGNSVTNGDIIASTWKTSVRYEDCAQEMNGMRMVMKGTTTSEGSLSFKGTPQPGQRPNFVSLNSRDTGEVTSTMNGEARTCTFDMTQTYEASSKSIRIKGTACGTPIDRVIPWG